MHRPHDISTLRVALLIPSFYGAATWALWLGLYELRLIAWEPTSPGATAIFLGVLLVFGASFVTAFRPYLNWYSQRHAPPALSVPEPPTINRWAYVAVLHLVGFIGLALYIRQMAAAFGGLPSLVEVFALSSYAIRWQSEVTGSVGTQLSYFGWVAIALTFQQYRAGSDTRWWLAIALAQFLGNLIYIDRTRPVWMLFTTMLVILAARDRVKAGIATMVRVALAASVFVGVFFAVAAWVGKVVSEGQYGASPLPPFAQNVYAYGTGGFAYFNRLLDTQEAITYVPERVLYPAFKAFAGLGLTSAPPSQINAFFYVPFPTNVGTFLEPFYRDGGCLFLILGIILQTFGLDLVGYALLRSGRPTATFAWANVCFVAFIGFFTPKITNLPVWLFTFLGIISALGQISMAPDQRDRSSHTEPAYPPTPSKGFS
jgi:hypothetical protein